MFDELLDGIALDSNSDFMAEDGWVTLHPNGKGKNADYQRVFIDDNGVIQAGLGEENVGRKASEVFSERKAEAKQETKDKTQTTAPDTNTEEEDPFSKFMREMMESDPEQEYKDAPDSTPFKAVYGKPESDKLFNEARQDYATQQQQNDVLSALGGYKHEISYGEKLRTTRADLDDQDSGIRTAYIRGTERKAATIGEYLDVSAHNQHEKAWKLYSKILEEGSTPWGFADWLERNGYTKGDLAKAREEARQAVKERKERFDKLWAQAKEYNRQGKAERRQSEHDSIKLTEEQKKILNATPIPNGYIRVTAPFDSLSGKFLIEKGNGYIPNKEFLLPIPRQYRKQGDFGAVIGIHKDAFRKDDRLRKAFNIPLSDLA
jgi:hypothetical protein